MKIQFKIGYYGYIVERSDIPVLTEIFSRATSTDGSFVSVSVEEAPNIELLKLKEEFTKAEKEETARYSKYWLDERAKTEKLEKRIKELESGE
jgi:hypothetical protein